MDALAGGSVEALAIFALVYLGMVLGGLPLLRLDRAGIALLGAIAVVGLGLLDTEAAARAIHLPTILLLFAFMVVSAQLRLGGFYGRVTRGLVALPLSPIGLLGAVIAVSGALSAVFTNDVVCLAMAPVLARACVQRRLDPLPFLLALACAANIGSAATLIGNPQNMLIGEVLKLSFVDYLGWALPPVLLGLLALWGLLAWPMRTGGAQLSAVQQASFDAAVARLGDAEPAFDRWQTTKGLVVAGLLMGVFLFTGWPRDVAALVGAGLLLLSRRLHSSQALGLVDWPLLVLFMGLFVVNQAMADTGLTARAVQALAEGGLPLSEPAPLFGATLLLSNLVSNVPAVMLLLPAVQASPSPQAGPALALVSTLAGNLLLVGSIANLIVADAAARLGLVLDWKRHARTGVPVTLVTLALTAAWLFWRAS